MAATVSIEIVVDDKDLAAASQRLPKQIGQIEPALQKVGQQGNVVFTKMAKDQQRARDAAQLLSQTIGIQVPRSIEKVIAKMPGLSAALATGFNAAAVAFFIVQIAKAVSNLDELRVSFSKLNTVGQVMVGQLSELLGFGTNLTLERERFFKQQALFLPLIQQETKLRREATLTTLHGFAEIEERRQQERQSILELENQQLRAAEQAFSRSEFFERAKVNITQATNKARIAADERAQQQRVALELQNRSSIVEAEGQIAVARSRGLGQIEAEIKAQLDRVEVAKAAGLDIEVAERRTTAIRIQGTRTYNDFLTNIENETLAFRAQKAAEGAAGIRAIELQLEEELRQIRQRELELGILLPGRRAAAEEAAAERIREIRRQVSEETLRFETQAAIAILPPWQQADAAIVASAQERVQQIDVELRRGEISNEDAARRSAAVWIETYAVMRDRLAASLEGLFDDITSGNIGRVFLNNFKRLIFQMVAQWILGMNQMRAASAGTFSGGARNVLGAIFSGLFGIPNIFGAQAQGSAATSASSTTAGASGAGVYGLPLGPSTAAQAAALSQLAILTPTAERSLGPLTPGTGLSAGFGFGSPLNLPAGASIGTKIGSLVLPGLGLLGSALLGSNNRFATTLGGLLTGGVIGTAIGSLLGGLFVFAGPIGAIVGAIFGFLAGGRKKRERERLENQLKAEIQKVSDAYKQHQIDFDSTIAQLEQLRAQFAQAQKKVGGSTRLRVHRHIDQAEAEIRAIEDERQRREALVFGPAQFHRGGIVASHLALAFPARRDARAFHGGDVVNANLLVGESVLNRDATRRIGRTGVERLNAGGGVGGEVTVQMIFPGVHDPRGFEETLQKNIPALIRILRRMDAEGAM